MAYPLRGLLGAVVALVLSGPPAAAERGLIHLGGGEFEVFKDGDEGAFQLEYRSGRRLLWRARPFGGAMTTSAEAIYVFGGLLADFDLGWNVVATPSLAAGYYDNGHGADLGHHLEFRSGIEFAYRFANDARLGVGLYHISNASIAEDNPGAEVLSVVFSYPIGGPR